MDTVILIPAYKPTEALVDFVKRLRQSELEVVVIDDGGGSDFDFVFDALEELCHVIRYTPNKGKGAAMKCGFAYIRENMKNVGYIVTADADGQHKIPDIIRVADKLREEKGNVIVTGARHFENEVPFRSRFGNSITRVVFNLLTRQKVTDTQTGLRGFAFDQLEWLEGIKGDRYEYEMNMLMKASDEKIQIKEVKIETVYENNNESSHFRPFQDSVRIYKTIFMASTAVKFLLSALLAFLIDFALYALLLRVFSPLRTELCLLLSTLFAWMVSSFTNFTVNRKVVFEKNDGFWRSFGGYYSLAVAVYFAKLLIVELLVFLHVNEYLAKLVAEVALFVSNYFIQKLLIFKSKKTDVSKKESAK